MVSPQHVRPELTPVDPLVLLVEDDLDSREMYEAGLQWAGFRVTSVADGSVAYDRAVSIGPSIVVADLHVPGLNGLELCRRLKRTESTARIPVIAVTGAAREGDVELAHAAGFDRVLIKPCPPDQLHEAIRALLARSARVRRSSTQAAQRSTELRTRSTSLALQSRVIQCRTAAMAGLPASLPCPDCAAALAWHETHTVAGIQFDYFTACEKGCGQYYFDHQRRRFMRLR